MVRVALTRFLLLSFGTLVVVGAGTVIVSENMARDEAIRDQQSRAEDLADSIADVLKKTDPLPTAEATRERERELADIAVGSMVPVVVWDEQGLALWAEPGSPFQVGARYKFPDHMQTIAEEGGSRVMEPGDKTPEMVVGGKTVPLRPPATTGARLLEVYAAPKAAKADDSRFMYEAHAPFPSIDDEQAAIFKSLLPLTLGALLLLQLANVPLALSLARRVDRSTDHRSMILSRSLISWHDERRRLAQDLHDGVIQDLSAMSYALPAVLAQLPDVPEADPARSIGERMTEALTQDLRALRSVLIDLVPADLDGNGLQQAIDALGQRSADRGLHVEVSVEPDLGIGSAVAGLVYRIAREGLRNAEKHAEARTASVHVARRGDCVEILIDDDGQGIRTPAVSEGHVGLRLLEELVADVGGDLSLTNVPGQGARLRGVIPALLPELGDESQ